MAKEKPEQEDPEFDNSAVESDSNTDDTKKPSSYEKTILYDSDEPTEEGDPNESDPRETESFVDDSKTFEIDAVDLESFRPDPTIETREDTESGLQRTFVPSEHINEDFELGSDIDEDPEPGDYVDEDLELGGSEEVEPGPAGKPVLDKTMVVDDGTLLSNEFDHSVDYSDELESIGISNHGWGKQNSSISNMSSLESPVRAKRPMVQPKLNDRLVVADGERKMEGNPDYRVRSFLGAGAMGEVYVARQTSVDRDVAFKKQIPKQYTSRRKMIRDRNKFLFEAQITANLDHPNIVAIHDMGRDQSGGIFYCMELVRGKPWEEVIADMTLEENLEVLLKVIDGVAYAHSKNTIHRDLKPENTMLGNFGEVLIMDWGLGVNLDNGLPQSMGGTPAFMAPEMAERKVEDVGKHSDIYLLGSMLFLIVTGEAPHTGEDAWECLDNARENNILDVSNSDRKIDKRLLAIALKAMSTEPENRHANPEQLRKAIENYKSNLLSIKLTERSEKELATAINDRDYEYFSKSMFGFREAIALWSSNAAAESGLQRSKLAYAQCALERQDFELGMSLLDANEPEEAPLFQKLRKGAAASRQRRRLVWIAIGSSLLLLTALVVTSWMNAASLAASVKKEKRAKLDAVSATEKAETEKKRAEKESEIAAAERRKAEAEREKAIAAEKIAVELAKSEAAERLRAENLAASEEKAKNEAVKSAASEKKAKDLAQSALKKAEESRELAELATKEKEAERVKASNLADELLVSEKSARELLFQSNIGLIDGYIRDNQIEQAIATLKRTRRNDSRFVNWEWNRLYHLCHTEVKSESLEGVTAIDQSDDGSLSIVSAIGKAIFWNPNRSDAAGEQQVAGGKAVATAISRDGKWTAIGTADPTRKLTIWDTSSGQMVANLSDDISASLVSCVAFNDTGTQLVAGDSTRVITLFEGNGANWNKRRTLGFHSQRPVDLDFNADGRKLVSVSKAGLSIVWDTNSGKPLSAYSHPTQLLAARFVPGRKGLVACATNDREIAFWNSSISNSPLTWQELPAAELKAAKAKGFIDSLVVHESVVNDLDFSDDGNTMMTCGDDRTIAVWNLKDRTLIKRFRGHVNAVLACCLAKDGNAAVSASADGQVRVWRFDEYEDQRTFAENSSPLNCVQFNSDASQMLTGGEDGAIRIWNCDTATRLESRLEFDPKLGRKAAYLPKSGLIVTSSPGNVFVWQQGKLIHSKSEVGNSGIVVTSRNERLMITGGDEDHPTIAWNLESGEKIATLLNSSSRNRVTAMAISPDDRYLALGTGQVEGIVSVFDLQTFQLVDEFEEHRGWVTDLVFSPASNEFLSADSVEGYVNAWVIDGNRVRRQKKIKGIGGSYIRIAYSDSGSQFVTSTNTDTSTAEIQVWDSQSKTAITKLQLARSIDFVSMIRDEVVFRLTNGKAYGWKHTEGKRHMRHVPLYSNASYPKALNGWSKIGKDKSLVYGDGFVKIVDERENTARRSIGSIANVFDSAGNPGPCVSASFADQEQLIVALYGDGAVRFWNRESNAVIHVVQSTGSRVTAIDVMPDDSRRLAVCDSEGVIRCIDVGTKAVLAEFETNSNLNSIQWLGRDSVLVTGSNGLSIVDLKTKTATRLNNIPGSMSGIDSSDSGSVLVGICVDRQNERRVYLWQKLNGEWRESPTTFGSQVLSVRVSPDGKRVFSGDASGAITVWYIPDAGASDPPRKLISLIGHEKEVSSIALSGDGSHVASSSKDGSAILWLSAEDSQ